MAMDMSRAPIPKGEPRARVKRRKTRSEAAVKRAVRAACVERDGFCRYAADESDHVCEWPSEWAHWGPWRRARTRGMAPEERHCLTGSLMLCQPVHKAYDSGQLDIMALSHDGCEGRLDYRWNS